MKKDKTKVSLKYNLDILESELNKDTNGENVFIPVYNHWTNMEEQKIKVNEIEDKT